MQANTSLCCNHYKESTSLFRAIIFYIRGESKRYGLVDTAWAWSFRCGFSFNLTIQKKLSGHIGPQSNMRLGQKEEGLFNSVPG